jgi:hypothetical protein
MLCIYKVYRQGIAKRNALPGGEGLSDENALARQKEELREKSGRDMRSVVFQLTDSQLIYELQLML